MFILTQCPQCGKRYTQNNIINLYVPEIAVPSNDLEKVSYASLLSLEVFELWPSSDACLIYAASIVLEREK